MPAPQSGFAGNKRFRVGRHLGTGGMGVVYEARDCETGALVALKTVRDLGGDDLLRLKTEFRALQDLQHPNLVSLGELLEEGGRWFFTMELIDGVSFLEYVRPGSHTPLTVTDSEVSPSAATCQPTAAQRLWDAALAEVAPLDEARLRDALRQLATGLDALHAAGKVHRDIKPANVLVTAAGRVVLLDLGLATNVGADGESVRGVVGTAAYMAPEQATGQVAGPAADWYSVGVMLFEALTGQLPVAGVGLAQLLAKQGATPPPPRSLVPGVPADLDRLCAELLRPTPGARPTGPQVLTRLGAPAPSPAARPDRSLSPSAPFIGREDELAGLADALATVRRGGAVTLVVHGESGVGKSALVQRFTEQLKGQHAVVLAGRCYERESVPYKAIDGVVDSLSRYLARLTDAEAGVLLPRSVRLLGDVFPVLRRVRTIAQMPHRQGEAPIDPQELRTRLFAAMRELVGRIADRRPLVIVIDDLQWADADGLALLAEILRPPEAPAVLAIATLRTEVPTTVPDLERFLPRNAQRVALGPLAPAAARELAAVLLTRGSMSSTATAEQIAAEAAGHPLFIDELVRHAGLRTGRSPGVLRLDEALRVRVAALEPASRHVLQLCALAGRPLTQEVVRRASSLERSAFARCRDELRGASFVQITGARESDTMGPYHDRIREAVVAHLGEEDRRARYTDLALALDGTPGADPELLAAYWRGAGDRERAAFYTLRAAAAAEAAFAFNRAAGLYQGALELRPGDATAPPEILRKLADSLANAGRGPEAAAAYGRAARDAAPAAALDLRRLEATQFMRSGHLDEGLAAMQELSGTTRVRLARSPGRAVVSLLLRRALLRVRGYRCRNRDASQVAAEELRRIDFCWWVAAAFGGIDTVRGTELNARALLMALRAGEPGRLARALATEAFFVAMGGAPARRRTATVLEAMRRHARQHDQPETRAFLAWAEGGSAYYTGRFAAALDHLRQAEQVFLNECAGAVWELDSVRLFLLFSLAHLGRIDELSRLAPQFVAEALDRGDLYAATNFRLSLPNLAWLVGDDVADARRMTREALQSWAAAGALVHCWFGLTANTQLDLYEGAGPAAAARLDAGWGALKRSLILGIQLVRIEAWHLRGRAALAAASASPDDQRRWLDEAERAAGKIGREKVLLGSPYELLLRAGVAALRGDREAAASRCAAAAADFDRIDNAAYAAAARRRQGQLVGGAAGAALVAAADGWMTGQRIVAPHRWTAMLAPGFPA